MARRQASGCEVNHSGAGDRDSTDSLKSGLQHCSRSSGILDTIPFPRLQDAGTVQGPWRGLQSVPVECLSQLPQPGWPPASLSASGSRVLLYPPTCPSMACSALPRGGSEQDQAGWVDVSSEGDSGRPPAQPSPTSQHTEPTPQVAPHLGVWSILGHLLSEASTEREPPVHLTHPHSQRPLTPGGR